MDNKVELTRYQDIPNTAHILYFYEDEDLYIDNMISYMKAGIERGHHLLIIENPKIYEKAVERMKTLLTPDEMEYIHYYDNQAFYDKHNCFQISKIVEHFSNALSPIFEKKLTARTWAHVDWLEQDHIEELLEEFEKEADYQVNNMGLISLCAYNAKDVPALLQTAMMKSHEFLMTDYELVKSSFYSIQK